MPATAVLERRTAMPTSTRVVRRNGHEVENISVETYFEKYRDREDGFKYELVNGRIEKTRKTMNIKQANIAHYLTRHFYFLLYQEKVQGALQSQLDNHLAPKHIRIPDMCWFTDEQLADIDAGGFPVAELMIEVVSPSDKAEYYAEKRKDYFKAGVKVLWLIFPNAEEVHVYTDTKHMVVCEGEEVCSAAPVLPEFALPAKDIFFKRTKKT